MPIIPHNPRAGQFTAPERAVKHEYDIRTEKWSRREVYVSLAMAPFQEGTNRSAYMMKDLSQPVGEQDCVAKAAKNAMEERQTYFNEVEMQCKCKVLAGEYNRRNPPKKIDFVHPCVMELLQRMAPTGKPLLMGVEPYLKGLYKKYSNNFGFVSEDDRSTPHAFSHFTHQLSQGQILICDIQGVEGEGQAYDLYTDPQIHSNLGRGIYKYGNGDMGIDGIRQFFATHRCNNICRMLGLSPSPSIAPPLCARQDINSKVGFGRGTSECSRNSSIGCSSGGSSSSSDFARVRSALMARGSGFPMSACAISPQVTTNFQPFQPAFVNPPYGYNFGAPMGMGMGVTASPFMVR